MEYHQHRPRLTPQRTSPAHKHERVARSCEAAAATSHQSPVTSHQSGMSSRHELAP